MAGVCKKKSLTSEMIKEIPCLKNLPSGNIFQVTSTSMLML